VFYGKYRTYDYNSHGSGKERVRSFHSEATYRTQINTAENIKHNSAKNIGRT